MLRPFQEALLSSPQRILSHALVELFHRNIHSSCPGPSWEVNLFPPLPQQLLPLLGRTCVSESILSEFLFSLGQSLLLIACSWVKVFVSLGVTKRRSRWRKQGDVTMDNDANFFSKQTSGVPPFLGGLVNICFPRRRSDTADAGEKKKDNSKN